MIDTIRGWIADKCEAVADYVWFLPNMVLEASLAKLASLYGPTLSEALFADLEVKELMTAMPEVAELVFAAAARYDAAHVTETMVMMVASSAVLISVTVIVVVGSLFVSNWLVKKFQANINDVNAGLLEANRWIKLANATF
jgi:hypothetical protein